MKDKTNGIVCVVLIIVGLFILFGFFYGWFSPVKPSVILHLAPNFTEIKGFTYTKYSGSMMCASCVNFAGSVKVYYNNTLICDATDSTISIGEVILAIRCDKKLANYKDKEVVVEAIGRVTPAWSKTIESYDNKTLILEFINR